MDPEQWDQTYTVNCSRLLDTNLTHRWERYVPLAQTRTHVTRLQVPLVATATDSTFKRPYLLPAHHQFQTFRWHVAVTTDGIRCGRSDEVNIRS